MYAIILAAGRGERLRPYTNDRPKPMVEIGVKPIIEYQLHQLKDAGIANVVIAENYLAEVIQKHLGNGKRLGINIHHIRIESESAGTAGAIKEAMRQIPQEEQDILLIYGDILSNLNIKDLIEKHHETKPMVTLLGIKPNFLPDGIVEVTSDGMLKDIKKEEDLYLVNGAIFVLRRDIYDHLPEQGDFSKDVLERIAGKEELRIYRYDGYWINIRDVLDLQEARLAFGEGRLRFENVAGKTIERV